MIIRSNDRPLRTDGARQPPATAPVPSAGTGASPTWCGSIASSTMLLPARSTARRGTGSSTVAQRAACPVSWNSVRNGTPGSVGSVVVPSSTVSSGSPRWPGRWATMLQPPHEKTPSWRYSSSSSSGRPRSSPPGEASSTASRSARATGRLDDVAAGARTTSGTFHRRVRRRPGAPRSRPRRTGSPAGRVLLERRPVQRRDVELADDVGGPIAPRHGEPDAAQRRSEASLGRHRARLALDVLLQPHRRGGEVDGLNADVDVDLVDTGSGGALQPQRAVDESPSLSRLRDFGASAGEPEGGPRARCHRCRPCRPPGR